MTSLPTKSALAKTVLSLGFAALSATAVAAPIFWTDWTGADLDPGPGFRAQGTITSGASTVTVTYTNSNGIAFYQPSGGIDYYTGGNASSSPYTSAAVDNRPTGTDIIALQFAGNQSLQFSEAIANPVFAYVSLNGNGYAFDRDFDILSVGDPATGKACGYWGCGTSYKEVVDIGAGVLEYRLLGTGEPHGTLRFLGAFDSVNWRSLSNENWNGFTVGVQGTAVQVFPTPEPGSLALTGLALVCAAAARRRWRTL